MTAKTQKTVTIKDYGRPEDLDGASMQFSINLGTYPFGATLAYCADLEHANVIQKALQKHFSKTKSP